MTEHKCSFSINSGNPRLPKCLSNNCTSSSEILSEKTLAQLYLAPRLTIFCSKCQSSLQTTVQVHSEIFQQFPSVTQISCYQRQGERYSHRTISYLFTKFWVKPKIQLLRSHKSHCSLYFCVLFLPNQRQTHIFGLIRLNTACRTLSLSPLRGAQLLNSQFTHHPGETLQAQV